MKRNHLIMGSAITLAAIAVAIDHTQHRLPEPEAVEQAETIPPGAGAPGGMATAPCGLGGGSPCSM
jgi:hypothetical protein